MNQSKTRQRKHSLVSKTFRDKQNQNNIISNQKTIQSQARSKSTFSIPKISTISQTKNNSFNTYLIGWGNIPFSPTYQHFKKIAKNVQEFALGDQHLVFINNKNEAYGMGNTQFGQLGYREKQTLTGIATPILGQLSIKNVFCGPYSTFLITDKNDVYACGLNNRGQLGISNKNKEISIINPTLIQSLSVTKNKKSDKNSNKINDQNMKSSTSLSKRTNSASKGKINSVSYQYQFIKTSGSKQLMNKKQRIPLGQLKQSRNININDNNELQFNQDRFETQDNCTYINRNNSKVISLLDQNQYIISISGGSYHTVALSNKGKVFYSGNSYSKQGIQNNQYFSRFIEIKNKSLGKMTLIKSGLTSFGMINQEGSLFLMGLFSENLICDQPSQLPIESIIDFSITEKYLYSVTKNGEVFATDITKLHLKTSKIEIVDKIKKVHSTLDYTLFETKKNAIYGQGDNSNSTLSWSQNDHTSNFIPKPTILNLLNGKLSFKIIKCAPKFVIGLCQYQKLPCLSINLQQKEILNKLQEAQKQNQLLKNLLAKKQKKISQSSINERQKSLKKEQISQNKSSISLNNINSRTFENSLQIPFQQLKLGKMISQGGYGIIYKAQWRKTSVAVKIFKIDENNQNSIKDFISQCRAMQVLRHPNIVMFLGVCTKPPNFAIVLQYCEGGTLWSLLQGNKQITWEQKRNLALDTARGMNYLHCRKTPILHRDLKSLNLLLDKNMRIKLADFGWTKGLQNYMTGKIGTYQWMAPQVVAAQKYTQKADIFSFGIILWQIASRQPPYRNIPGAQVAHDVFHKQLRPIIPKKTPQHFSNLMKRCWNKVPQIRPSFSQIIEQLQSMHL